MDGDSGVFDPNDPALEHIRRMTADDYQGRVPSDIERLTAFKKLAETGNLQTLVPILPLLLNLDNKPYSLKHHYQFEPMFRTRRPRRTLLYTGRQVAKTTYEAADGVVQSLCIRNLKTLYVTPLFEQARRLSTDRVRKFIDQSPVRHMFSSSKTENSVLRKTFNNGSVMHFSFALLDADRTRGISADKICYDEIQDIDKNHIPVINECMSHSWLKLVQYAGTPKTPENTISGLWRQSSQAEWFIPCRACNQDNICSTDWHLDKIIGPAWDPGETTGADGSVTRKPFLGTVCAHCSRLIDPADGFWVHRHPDRRWDFAGYHIPQPIMHIHYSDPRAWAELLAKREGFGNYTPARYFNEVLGEACGTGVQIVSQEELQAAALLPWQNDPRDYTKQLQHCRKYAMRVLAVDWGGGGEDEISLTTMAVLGYLPNGQIHVIWARRLMTPHDHMGEADYCLKVFRDFKCHFMAHDYTGAGSLRETFLVHNQADMLNKIIPIAYIGAATKGIMTFKPATDIHPRNHYLVDKTRSLLLTCASIKTKMLRFFQYDHTNADNPGLIEDFLGLVENKVPTHSKGDIYTIQRHVQLTDDFAQAVNIGCCALWHVNQKWPNLGRARQLAMTEEQLRAAVAQRASDWNASTDIGPMGIPGQ
jgi:hypothetical protein